jgi:hypothetical protein
MGKTAILAIRNKESFTHQRSCLTINNNKSIRMKKIRMIVGGGLIGVWIFSACSKDNSPVLTPLEQKLTAKIWRLNSLTVPKVSDAAQDSSITLPCSDSALAVFDVYHNYQVANPTKYCDSTIVPYDLGRWAFNSSEDSLILTGNRKRWVLKILQFTDTTLLKATYKDSMAPDKVWIKTISLK